MLDHRILSTVRKSYCTQTGHHSIAGANAGHLPNALNIPYTDVLDQSNHGLKSHEELKQGMNLTTVASIISRLSSSLHQGRRESIEIGHLHLPDGYNSEHISLRCPRSRSEGSIRVQRKSRQGLNDRLHISASPSITLVTDGNENLVVHQCAKVNMAVNLLQNARTVRRECSSRCSSIVLKQTFLSFSLLGFVHGMAATCAERLDRHR